MAGLRGAACSGLFAICDGGNLNDEEEEAEEGERRTKGLHIRLLQNFGIF